MRLFKRKITIDIRKEPPSFKEINGYSQYLGRIGRLIRYRYIIAGTIISLFTLNMIYSSSGFSYFILLGVMIGLLFIAIPHRKVQELKYEINGMISLTPKDSPSLYSEYDEAVKVLINGSHEKNYYLKIMKENRYPVLFELHALKKAHYMRLK